MTSLEKHLFGMHHNSHIVYIYDLTILKITHSTTTKITSEKELPGKIPKSNFTISSIYSFLSLPVQK